MIDEFLSKLNNQEYISNHLYEYVLGNNREVIPNGFDIDKYNDEILNKLYASNKDYFDHMYDDIDPNIHLDEDQCKAILADEKYSLIIAGAGTGKTTTMTSKVKYLVDKKNADPERILVMSYTRKATEEIAKRISANFNIPVHVTTFHSLGYEYINQIFKGRKCQIVDRNKKNEIFLKYFKELFKHKEKIEEIINNFEVIKIRHRFLFGKYFIQNYTKFDSYDDFVDEYVKYKLEEARKVGTEKLVNDWIQKQLLKDENIISVNGEYVKSAGEMMIANYLYIHGIDYQYEEVYQELMENNSIYRPDFTIDYGGRKIYIEYFGMDDDNYNKVKLKKEEFHKIKGNDFIEIDRLPLNKIVETLKTKLLEYNVVNNDRTFDEVYEHILRLNPTAQIYPFAEYLYENISTRKESSLRDNNKIISDYIDTLEGKEKEEVIVQNKYLEEFYKFYSNELYGGDVYYFDFCDLLYYSVKYLEKLTHDTHLRFDYIVIDEYQDISKIKYELTYKTAKRNDAKVYAVGDDWQSIYAFSGARIEYIYRFKDYFKGAKVFKILKTYRNSQELIDYSGEFIMRNSSQFSKQLVSDKHLYNPIVIKNFDSKEKGFIKAEIDCLKETILEIHNQYPDRNILVLARTNRSIDRCLDDDELIDSIGSKIVFKGNENIDIDGMTMHKSKGLTYDEVIVIGLTSRFPSDINEISWYEQLYKMKPEAENIPFAEERRVFYVALTRTKNHVYLLCDANYKSEFVTEIEKIINLRKEA